MRYDFIDLELLRYPCGKESMVDLVKLAVIDDGFGLMYSIAGRLESDEISVEYLNPNRDNILNFFHAYHPEAMMINTDTFDYLTLKKFTGDISRFLSKLPFIITYGNKRNLKVDALLQQYSGHYYIKPPLDPMTDIYHLQKILTCTIIDKNYYLEKIRKCVVVTQTALHCPYKYPGFDYLAEVVCKVLRDPYVYRANLKELVEEVAEEHDITVQTVDVAIKKVLDAAYKECTEYERKMAFPSYNGSSNSQQRTIYCIAKISSQPCRDLLYKLDNEPYMRRR